MNCVIVTLQIKVHASMEVKPSDIMLLIYDNWFFFLCNQGHYGRPFIVFAVKVRNEARCKYVQSTILFCVQLRLIGTKVWIKVMVYIVYWHTQREVAWRSG